MAKGVKKHPLKYFSIWAYTLEVIAILVQKILTLDGGGGQNCPDGPPDSLAGLPSKTFVFLKNVKNFQYAKIIYRVSQKSFRVAKKKFRKKFFFQKMKKKIDKKSFFFENFKFNFVKKFFLKIWRKFFWQPWNFLRHPVNFSGIPEKCLPFF